MSYPQNTPIPEDLLGLNPQEIAQLPVELLAVLQREIDERLKHDMGMKARLDGALIVRYVVRSAEVRQALGKDTGTVRFDDGDLTIIADLPKRVVWDQESLARFAGNLAAAGENPSEFIDTIFTECKREFGALAEAWRTSFERARKVELGPEAFRFIPQGDDQ